MSSCDLDQLTLKVRGRSNVTWSEIELSPDDLLIILLIYAHVISAVTLTFDRLILNFYSTSGVMRLNSTKFERNRIIHGW